MTASAVIQSVPGDSQLRSAPGTYALILSCSTNSLVRVGRLGRMRLQPGFYVYVGSAHGRGGLSARTAHHRKRTKRPHWHIDYLRSHARLDRIWYCCAAVRREHEWARALGAMSGAAMPMAGFGASDCDCASHLYFFRTSPTRGRFESSLRNAARRSEPLLRNCCRT
jgi:Uri superfamily endonuclease